MIEPFILEETDDTPKVVLDKENNNFEISGKSLPEDAMKFFEPIQKWIIDYIKNPNQSTEFKLNLEYFNSASAKKIVDILINLEDLSKSGKEIKIIWYFGEDDELMENKGEEIKSIIDIPFELRSF